MTPARCRLKLGFSDNGPSYVIRSRRGLDWHNIPEDLEDILESISPDDVKCLDLGDDGKFAISYYSGGSTEFATNEPLIERLYEDESLEILTIALGTDEDYWITYRRPVPKFTIEAGFESSRCGTQEALGGLCSSDTLSEVEFVALGAAGSFLCAMKNGTVLYDWVDQALKVAIQEAQDRGVNIVGAALCPVSRTRWYLEFDDGTVQYQLSGLINSSLKRHFDPKNALVRGLAVQSRTVPSSLIPASAILESTVLTFLPWTNAEYTAVSTLFYSGWRHPHKRMACIRSIFAIVSPPSVVRAYNTYRDMVTLQRSSGATRSRLPLVQHLFHGTKRQCTIGADSSFTTLCSTTTCNMCSILRQSFNVEKARGTNFQRFGGGIYTTSASSKADDYSVNVGDASNLKAMILSEVVIGKAYSTYKNILTLTAPPIGYDSVIGEVGEDLNYDEQVVYRNDAILPVFLVVYEV